MSKDRVTRRQKSIPRLLREKRQIHKDKLKADPIRFPKKEDEIRRLFPS